jgi:hypothetical protein
MLSMMPRMMMQMFGGAAGAHTAMKPGREGNGNGAAPGPLEDFKPWEICPCREYCKQGCAPGKI